MLTEGYGLFKDFRAIVTRAQRVKIIVEEQRRPVHVHTYRSLSSFVHVCLRNTATGHKEKERERERERERQQRKSAGRVRDALHTELQRAAQKEAIARHT
ncbi:hypothetical protein ANTPLA_LOCUS9303 [Anthophora plagiata]